MTTCSTNYKFAGYEQDSETGLYYAMARYYNPRLGRFMSPDPLMGDIRNPQTLNRYAYVANNPLNLVDPLGLSEEDEGAPETTCTVDGAQFSGDACDFFYDDLTGGGGGGDGGDSQPEKKKDSKCQKLQAANPNQFKFVQSNSQNAQFIASFLNTSAANILGLSAFESNYGASPIAQSYGNDFGLTYPFPGSGPAYHSPNGYTYSTFDTSNGFLNSGLSFALSSQGAKVNGANSAQDFVNSLLGTAGAGSYNSTDPNYMNGLLGTINFVQKALNCLDTGTS